MFWRLTRRTFDILRLTAQNGTAASLGTESKRGVRHVKACDGFRDDTDVLRPPDMANLRLRTMSRAGVHFR